MAEERKEMIIGTREAAVLSCVNVIAAVTAQREELLAYWLDLYYQVRLAYVLCVEDLQRSLMLIRSALKAYNQQQEEIKALKQRLGLL